jgi:hypothetical protein
MESILEKPAYSSEIFRRNFDPISGWTSWTLKMKNESNKMVLRRTAISKAQI